MSMSNTEKRVKDIRRKTRRNISTEEKIQIVLDGLRGEVSFAELCRREGINANLYYRWNKDFLEAGKKRLAGDTVREVSASLRPEHYPDIWNVCIRRFGRTLWQACASHHPLLMEVSISSIKGEIQPFCRVMI